MKKLLIVMFAAVLVITIFAACEKTDNKHESDSVDSGSQSITSVSYDDADWYSAGTSQSPESGDHSSDSGSAIDDSSSQGGGSSSGSSVSYEEEDESDWTDYL